MNSQASSISSKLGSTILSWNTLSPKRMPSSLILIKVGSCNFVVKKEADDQKWHIDEHLLILLRVYSIWIRSSGGRPSKLLSILSSLEKSLLDLSR